MRKPSGSFCLCGLAVFVNVIFLTILHTTGDAQCGGDSREDANSNLNDGFPSVFFHKNYCLGGYILNSTFRF